MLTGIFIGTVAAAGAAALCAACYIKGRKDGRKNKNALGGEPREEQNALMQKYETIMGYDPYGERV
ncbi:MAG: hypothetical protein WDA65_02735 [Christensenellales bacterium]